MAAWADTLLVVATEEPTSLTDAYATLKLHAADRPGGDARVVVNQAGSTASGERHPRHPGPRLRALPAPHPAAGGIVRRDDKVRDAIRRQALLLNRHPASPAAADVERIAAALR